MDASLTQQKSCGRRLLFVGIAGVVAFHLAFIFDALSFLILIYLWSLYEMRLLNSQRKAFTAGTVIGVFCFGPQLYFFWTLFGFKSIALWLILGFWVGLFTLLIRYSNERIGPKWTAILTPWLWLGLDYFRGELYYLRFSWFSPAFAFAHVSNSGSLLWLGVYGTGFVLVALVAIHPLIPSKWRLSYAFTIFAVLAVWTNFSRLHAPDRLAVQSKVLNVAGIQMEFPTEQETLDALEKLARKLPATQLVVLSEYAFDGPIPPSVKQWCRKHHKYLIAGGKERSGDSYFNTAFVVGPDGEICFKQAKMVPVQFMLDGLPATEQSLWDSPWGKIGLSICYDSSYRRVMDRLVELGAQAIISPMMDVEDWGEWQHQLHSRVPRVRSAEYGIPMFRVGSSGISQLVDASGMVIAHTSFPGKSEIISGQLTLGSSGKLPLDYWPCRLAAAVTIIMLIQMATTNLWFSKRALKPSVS